MKIIDRQTGQEVQIKFFRTQPEVMKHATWADDVVRDNRKWVLLEFAIGTTAFVATVAVIIAYALFTR